MTVVDWFIGCHNKVPARGKDKTVIAGHPSTPLRMTAFVALSTLLMRQPLDIGHTKMDIVE